MLRTLVTGGAGFIGSNFVRYLLESQPDVHVYNLDALTYSGSLDNLTGLSDPTRHTFIEGDICNRTLVEQLLTDNAIELIVHFAAETHVDRSILDPKPFIQSNIVGTYTLLDAARVVWQKGSGQQKRKGHFHHVSTDEVYGSLGPEEEAFTELTPYTPNSPYAASKAASDHLVRAYHHTYGLDVSITNCSNNYGPHMFPEKLIPLIILNAIEGHALPIYGDGKQIRDWLYVRDHCEAIWTVIQNGKIGETYNIGGNNQPTNLSVVKTICETLDDLLPNSPHVPHSSLIQFVVDRPGHDRRYAMDITKIETELGWHPRFDLASGLRETVDWYLAHPDWVDSIRKKNDYQAWLRQNYTERGR